MSDAPYDIQDYFDANGDELELHEIFVQQSGWGFDGWIEMTGARRRLDSTMLVVLYQRGAKRIAVKHEDRVVEFELYDVILRAGKLVGTVRE